MVKEIKIVLSNRLNYTLIAIGILIVSGMLVYAGVPGVSHDAEEINLYFEGDKSLDVENSNGGYIQLNSFDGGLEIASGNDD